MKRKECLVIIRWKRGFKKIWLETNTQGEVIAWENNERIKVIEYADRFIEGKNWRIVCLPWEKDFQQVKKFGQVKGGSHDAERAT
jgi:hypothetical protein